MEQLPMNHAEQIKMNEMKVNGSAGRNIQDTGQEGNNGFQ